MNPRKWVAGFALIFLTACGGESVEQIEVSVPDGVTVPEEMVYIPAGKFIMGSPKDPKTLLGKKVDHPAFLIDRFEVTRESYKKWDPDYPPFGGKGNYPAQEITWQQAEQYCKAGGKRLPTEVEWEKAARGTDGRKWPWGLYQDHPNNGFSGFLPEEVDERPEWISPYGVYGMGHNVWEWTASVWDYPGMPEVERNRFKVIRGGLYQSHLKIDYSPTYARNFMPPDARYNFLGFRCAKDAGKKY